MNVSIFKNKHFSLFLFGISTSLFGDVFLNIALSLYVLEKTGSARQFSTVLAISFLPKIFISPFAGAIVDRIKKLNLMIYLDIARGLYLFLLFGFHFFIEFNMILIYGTVIFFSIADTFFGPCEVSLIPNLVKKDELVTANTILRITADTSSVAAPVAGAFVFGIWGIGLVLLIDGITYIISAIAESLMRVQQKTMNQDKTNHILKDIYEGLQIIFKDIRISSILINGVLTHLFLFPFVMIGVPYLLIKVFHGPEHYFGIVESLMTVGLVVSAIFVSLTKKKLTLGQNINLGIFGMVFVCLFFLCLLHPDLYQLFQEQNFYALIFFSSTNFLLFLVFGFYAVFYVTFYQQNIPEGYLGRYISTFRVFVALGRVIGFKVFGYLFETNITVAVFSLIIGMCLKIIVHIPFLIQEREITLKKNNPLSEENH
ncbi:MAG: MFS transporter [Spirochaetes bacterium]|nr:MFS transporter [Spirochaetota bacterium]